jgi:hypothetical protein
MSNPIEPTDLAQLQQENAPPKRNGVHVVRGTQSEAMDNALRKVLHIFMILWASFITLAAFYVTVHILVGHVFVVKNFPGQGPAGDFRPISNANYHSYVTSAGILWSSAALMWNTTYFLNKSLLSCNTTRIANRKIQPKR